MEFEETRVSGARYYVVYPVLNCGIKEIPEYWKKMEQWCEQQHGPTPADGVWTPGAVWYSNNARFYFRNKSDALLFALKWT